MAPMMGAVDSVPPILALGVEDEFQKLRQSSITFSFALAEVLAVEFS